MPNPSLWATAELANSRRVRDLERRTCLRPVMGKAFFCDLHRVVVLVSVA
jgi:hypothetical protein